MGVETAVGELDGTNVGHMTMRSDKVSFNLKVSTVSDSFITREGLTPEKENTLLPADFFDYVDSKVTTVP